jgi:hypothetical protein
MIQLGAPSVGISIFYRHKPMWPMKPGAIGALIELAREGDHAELFR